ncbi:hypothetical protein D9M69_495970 [compost metagenome]
MQLGVGLIDRQRLREVHEVAVQVDVLVRHAAAVRKAVRVERMHVQHRHALRLGLLAPFGVVQREHLHAAAAVAFDAVAGAGDDEQPLGVGVAVERHVHRQLFAVAALERVCMRLDREAGADAALQELLARLGVARRKGLAHADHAAAPPGLRNCSAICTQQVAPSGMRSSLKS